MPFLSDADDQYLVFHRDGESYPRSRFERTLEQTVADIIGGHLEHIDIVWRVNIADRTSGDATEDVARLVLQTLLENNEKASLRLRNWIENALGHSTADCVTEWEAA